MSARWSVRPDLKHRIRGREANSGSATATPNYVALSTQLVEGEGNGVACDAKVTGERAAELHVTASLAAMLTATAPMWSALFSALWLGERIGSRRRAGLVLGVAGVAVLVGWSPLELTTAVAFSIVAVLIATCSYVLATIYAKRNLAGVPAPTLALGQQLGAAALLAVPAAVSVPNAHPTTTAVLALVALAVLCTAVAYLLFFRLVASIGPTKLSTVTYIIPVFGTTWGALFLGEPVTRGMIAGLALILASIVLVNEVRFGRLLRLRRSVPA